VESYLGRRDGRLVCGDEFAMQPTTALVPSPTPQEPLGGRLAADIEEFPSSSPSEDGDLSGVREKEMRDATTDDKKRRGQRKCITTQPPIFAHHHPFGGESNIGRLGGGYARNVETKYVRLSTRMDLEGLLRGDPEETLVDQWPDY